MKPPRVVVVGAGIAGLSVAHALRTRGVPCTVVADTPSATAAGAGIASVAFRDASLRAHAERSLAILSSLVPVHRVGMAQIALSRRTAAALEGPSARVLPPALARALSPAFRARVVATTWARADLWLSVADLLREMGRGVKRVRARVTAVSPRAVRTTRGTLAADAVVVAAGPWSARFLGRGALVLRRAETARIDARLPAMLHVADTGFYARPDGRFALAGDGDAPWRAADVARIRPSAAGLARIAREATAVFGRPVAAMPVSAGVLAFSRSGAPIIRRDGSLWVLAGFGGDGLSLAPSYGESVSEELATIS